MNTALSGKTVTIASSRSQCKPVRSKGIFPALPVGGKSMRAMRAGPAQAAPAKTRTEMPDLPNAVEEADDSWFKELYAGDKVVPWDTGKEQPLVAKMFEQGLFTSPVVDLGCGFGTNAIFLGSKGLEAFGIDLSPDAVAEAESRAAAAGAKVTFKAGSVLDLASIFGEQKFSSALDSALYHCLDDATNEKYLAALHKQMMPGGKLVLMAASDRNPAEDWKGPRRISKADLQHSLREEAGWKLESLDTEAEYEIPEVMKKAAPQFEKGYLYVTVAIATKT